MLEIAVLCVLGVVSFVLHTVATRAEATADSTSNASFLQLQRKFFLVYFLATFADWLQGPYVYKLYSHYGYSEDQIAVLYVAGFASSVTFGTLVGALADLFGRRRLCVVYGVLYSACCLTKLTRNYQVLLAGRVLGGISTSILFSTFEAWYVHQHVEKCFFDVAWTSRTFSKATFYNGLLAILAGVVSNLAAEWLGLGPLSPFLLAVPCLALASVLARSTWQENSLKPARGPGVCRALRVIFAGGDASLLLLGAVQSLLESVMYVFVFLWTPVLEPVRPPLGIVFSCFMVCIMVGSSLYSLLLARGWRADQLLTASLALAFVALAASALASARAHARACFAAFLLFEVAVGAYYPAITYLRSEVVPEELRAGIISWFRVPMNLLTCASLLWLRQGHGAVGSSHVAFSACACFLLLASALSRYFSVLFRGKTQAARQAPGALEAL
ncbi:molybdate-anion transporter-like [Bacillus rossius redtenbacheri]|uniref:molybdate-anion transporter-like n=1 Tax=Bacillus rossius redtenbacheri TaxID=93214 RepID=UPI002FDE7DCF